MIDKKAKGSRLEYAWRDMLRGSGLDKFAQRSPMSGAIPGIKADILTSLPFSFECKNTERLKPLAFFNQAKLGLNIGSGKAPVVVMKSNNTPIFVMMEARDWIDLACKAFCREGMKIIKTKEDAESAVREIVSNFPHKSFRPVPKPAPRTKRKSGY